MKNFIQQAINLLDSDFKIPQEKLETLQARPIFKKIMNHAIKSTTYTKPNLDFSDYDLKLANLARIYRWTGFEIIALLKIHRKKWGNIERLSNPKYVEYVVFLDWSEKVCRRNFMTTGRELLTLRTGEMINI